MIFFRSEEAGGSDVIFKQIVAIFQESGGCCRCWDGRHLVGWGGRNILYQVLMSIIGLDWRKGERFNGNFYFYFYFFFAKSTSTTITTLMCIHFTWTWTCVLTT